MLLVLSPWAVRNLRFDEALALGHGYDVDYCLQARAAGRKVMTADLALTHHQSLELVEDLVLDRGAPRIAEKWQGRMPGDDPGSDEPTEASGSAVPGGPRPSVSWHEPSPTAAL